MRQAFTPCLQYTYAAGKNTSDIAQALDALEALFDAHFQEVRSSRAHILSLHVLLRHIEHRGVFVKLWQAWIGNQPEHWPQRACFQAELAPGLLVELVAVAADSSASQRVRATGPLQARAGKPRRASY